MPSRIVREGILDSAAVNALSDSGEIFYRRLMSIVDDYGRFEARPSVLRTRLFGEKLEQWPLERVSQALAEVSQMPTNGGRIPLVSVYEVDGKKYLEIQNFKQRVRAAGSKYPGPTVRQMLGACQSSDGQETDVCSPSARATTPPSHTTPDTNIERTVLKFPEVTPGLEEFKAKWQAGTRSTIGLTGLDSLWFDSVTPENVADAFACLESYLGSKQVADGVVARAERWFMEQAREKWSGRWPPARADPRALSRQQQNADAWREA